MYTDSRVSFKGKNYKGTVHNGETVPHFECLPSCIHRGVYKPVSEIRAHLVLDYNSAI